jgi:ubiquinone/menaquinone biosynthesis C-methylase UbiE
MSDLELTDAITSDYWTDHNVTLHSQFGSRTESLEYFKWRNDQYFNYIELMPVSGFDGQVILDYGCGPGNDLVGFSEYSKPARLVGADVSRTSLAESRARLELHKAKADLVLLDPAMTRMPFEDDTFDHIHSSGVLHHTPHPDHLLRELARILKPQGTMNIMIYNYDSLWLHLYVAFCKQIEENLWPEDDVRSAFRRTTDGEDCPISNVYKPKEWIALWECKLLEKRFTAMMSQRLSRESREFLKYLEFDSRGYPMHNGYYAGVDGCFSVTKA